MGPSVECLLKICSNGSALLNKMAARNMMLMLKHLKIFFSSFEAESWYSTGDSKSTKFVQLMILG